MNYKVVNSYKIQNLEDIYINVLYYYKNNKLDKRRSIDSYIEEWFAHNWLYNLGLFRSHARDTDLDGNETFYRLIIYKLIFKLFARRKKDE